MADAEAFAEAQYRQFLQSTAAGGSGYDPVLAQHKREMEERRARIKAYRGDLQELIQVKREVSDILFTVYHTCTWGGGVLHSCQLPLVIFFHGSGRYLSGSNTSSTAEMYC